MTQEVIRIECKAKELPAVTKQLAEEMAKIGVNTLGEYKEYLGRLN